MTRAEHNAKVVGLESRILNSAYKAMQGGRFENAWRQLRDRSVDQLQAVIDERIDNARDSHEDLMCERALERWRGCDE